MLTTSRICAVDRQRGGDHRLNEHGDNTAAMAAARAKAQPVGSTAWIQSEREQADQFVEQEAEEFSYTVRNELEWLQEHMADIFSKNHVYVYN